jgi:hypothetical protein
MVPQVTRDAASVDDTRELFRMVRDIATSVRQGQSRVLMMRFASTTVLLATVGVSFFLGATQGFERLAIAPTLIAFLYVAAFEIMVRARYLRTIRRDQRALAEVLSLLRETESLLATTGQWTALDRARFRIEVSRFDIVGRE